MIVLKPEADRDLAEASGWYEGKQIGLGVDFLVEVDRTFARIERRPAGYRKIRGELRRVVMQRYPYCVFYLTVGQSVVTIYGVIHHRRVPAEWEQRFPE